MTRMFLHLMCRSLHIPAIAICAALLLTMSAAGQPSSTPPAPPRPEAEEESSKNETASDRSGPSREDRSSARETARDSARSGRDRSASDRSDSRRSASDDSDRSRRDRSARDDDDEDDRSASSRSDSSRSDVSRDRDDDDDSDRSDRRDTRSFSRDADEDRFRDRDDDSDDRSSSGRSSRDDDDARDRYSSRDRDDRSSARDRLRDDVRETARDVRDTVRDARDTTRETVRDARSTARSVAREARQEFDVQTARAADVGIWFNRSTSNGLLIRDVANTGPIARLGFREGDRIISVDGYRVSSERQFVQDLFYDDIRYERVPVVVYRNGVERTIYVEPATLVEHYTSIQNDPLEKFGLVLDDRYTDRLVVWKIIPRTPAYYAGVRKGDVITTWDNTRVTRPDQFTQLVERAEESGDNEVRLTIYRGQQSRQLEVEFPQVATRVERRTSYRPSLEEDTGTYTESYPAVEGTTRPGVINRPGVLPRPGILPRNR